MIRERLVTSLLEALERQTKNAVGFARRHDIRDPEFVGMVMQETAVRILEDDADSFRPTLGTADAYTAGILRYVCGEVHQKFYRQSGFPAGFDARTDDFNPVSVAIRNEEMADARAALQRLSPPDRMLVDQWAKPRHERANGNTAGRGSALAVQNFRVRQRFLRELLKVRSDNARRE